MSTEETTNKDSYVIEKWWHRLLRVLMYGTTLIVLAIAGVILIGDTDYYTYTYSFEPEYGSSNGEVHACTSYDYGDAISCGGLDTGSEFITYYLKTRGYQPVKSGKFTVAGIIQELRDRGESDNEIAHNVLKTGGINYKREQHRLNFIKNTSFAIGIGILWFVFTLVIYKVLLFVAHGHTRVRKA